MQTCNPGSSRAEWDSMCLPCAMPEVEAPMPWGKCVIYILDIFKTQFYHCHMQSLIMMLDAKHTWNEASVTFFFISEIQVNDRTQPGQKHSKLTSK